MDEKERVESGIYALPSTLNDALTALSEDELLKNALGKHIYNNFVEAKKSEWTTFLSSVSEWEKEQYLTL